MLLALLVTGVAVWLHFNFLFHAGGFWRDEVNLINLAKLPTLQEMSRDSFPVLMPLVVRTWDAVGLAKSDITLRLLGTMVGLGMLAALWLAAWKFRRSPPLPGLALLALNGTVIVFGDSLRAYGLGSLLILLTVLAAWWFLANPTWARAIGWALLAILSVQTLYQNAVFIAAICAGAWAVGARQKLAGPAFKVLLVGMAAAASLLPYLSGLLSLPKAAASLRTGIELGRIIATFAAAVGFPMDQTVWLWLAFALMLLVFGAIAIFRQSSSLGNRVAKPALDLRWTTLLVALTAAAGFLWFAAAPATHWWFLALLAVVVAVLDGRCGIIEVPATAEFAGGAHDKYLPLFAGTTLLLATAGFAGFLWYAALATEPWYFITLMAIAAGCFELGLPVRGHARAAIFGFSLVTVIVAGVVIFSERKAVNWRFTNVDILAPKLAANVDPQDFIIVSPWYCGITFERYFKGQARWETLPPLADHSFARYDLVHAAMSQPQAVKPLIEQATATLRAGHRVWLVGMMGIPTPGTPAPSDLPPAPLPHSGWADRPYTQNWLEQVNQFLCDHSSGFEQVYETPAGNLNFMEKLEVYRVEGWRD